MPSQGPTPLKTPVALTPPPKPAAAVEAPKEVTEEASAPAPTTSAGYLKAVMLDIETLLVKKFGGKEGVNPWLWVAKNFAPIREALKLGPPSEAQIKLVTDWDKNKDTLVPKID